MSWLSGLSIKMVFPIESRTVMRSAPKAVLSARMSTRSQDRPAVSAWPNDLTSTVYSKILDSSVIDLSFRPI